MPRADGIFCIVILKQPTLTIDGNDVRNKTLIDRESAAPFSNTKASVREEGIAIKGETETINNGHQVPEVEVGASKRYDTHDRPTHLLSAAAEDNDSHQPHKSNYLDVLDKKKQTSSAEEDRDAKVALGQARNTIK